MKTKIKNKVIGLVIAALMIALMVLLVYYIFNTFFPGFWPLLRRGDEKGIAEYLYQVGEWKGFLMVVLMCIVQVMSIVIPGLPIHVAAGLIYGWWKATIFCYFGFVLGNLLVFVLARKAGRRIERYIPGINQESWITREINSSQPEFVIALACMIPGVPNGILPYIAARTSLKEKSYGEAIAATSWLQILCNCLCGHLFIREHFILSALVMGAQLMLVALLARNRVWILKMLRTREQA